MTNHFGCPRKFYSALLLSILLSVAVAGCGDGESSDEVDQDAGVPTEDVEEQPGDVEEQDAGPAVELAEIYDLSGDDLHPESGDYDPQTQGFFVGSLAHGNVTRIETDDSESIFFEGNDDNDRASLGIRADVERRRLWVCSILNDGVEPGLIWVLDLDDATMLHEYDLTDTFEGASCNDIEIDSQGRAYVMDRQNPHIYRIDADDESVQIWANHDELEPDFIGLNGVALTPDEDVLIVTKYYPARLIRISVNDPTEVTPVEFPHDSFTGDGALSGADGILFLDDRLYVAFADLVMRLDFEEEWSVAYASEQPVSTGLAALILAEDALYAVKGEVAEFALGLEPDLPFQLIRVDLDSF